MLVNCSPCLQPYTSSEKCYFGSCGTLSEPKMSLNLWFPSSPQHPECWYYRCVLPFPHLFTSLWLDRMCRLRMARKNGASKEANAFLKQQLMGEHRSLDLSAWSTHVLFNSSFLLGSVVLRTSVLSKAALRVCDLDLKSRCVSSPRCTEKIC